MTATFWRTFTGNSSWARSFTSGWGSSYFSNFMSHIPYRSSFTNSFSTLERPNLWGSLGGYSFNGGGFASRFSTPQYSNYFGVQSLERPSLWNGYFSTNRYSTNFSSYQPFSSFRTSSYQTPTFMSRTLGTAKTQNFALKDLKLNKPSLTLQEAGYNAEVGQKLASISLKNARGFTGYCATYVKRDLDKAGLGNGAMGHGYMCADALRKNPHFKEISANGLDLKKLPAGCVLVYGRGVAGYSKAYGHVEITDGTGRAVSDGITHNIRSGAKVFVPVAA